MFITRDSRMVAQKSKGELLIEYYFYGLYGKFKEEAEKLEEARISDSEKYIRKLVSGVRKITPDYNAATGYTCESACRKCLQLTSKEVLQMEVCAVSDYVQGVKNRQVYLFNQANKYVYMLIAQAWLGKEEYCGDTNHGEYQFYCVVIGKKSGSTAWLGDETYNKALACHLAYNFVFTLATGDEYKIKLSDAKRKYKVEQPYTKKKYILLEHILCEYYSGLDISAGVANGFEVHHDQYKFDLRQGSIMFLSTTDHTNRHKLIGTVLSKKSHDFFCFRIKNWGYIPVIHNVPTYYRQNVFQ